MTTTKTGGSRPKRTPGQLKDAILSKAKEIDRAFGDDVEIKSIIINAPTTLEAAKRYLQATENIDPSCGTRPCRCERCELQAAVARQEAR